RGELWLPAINKELAETSIGIICLTKENINAPWILFEAGALAKGLEANRVITFLIDLNPEDVSDPLAQFNHTKMDKNNLKLLINTVNSHVTNSLPTEILEKVFNKYWDEFETKFNEILSETIDSKPSARRP